MPAPGANGLRRGSIYRKFTPSYRHDINWDKLSIIQAEASDPSRGWSAGQRAVTRRGASTCARDKGAGNVS